MYEQNNVRVWASILDPNTMEQAERSARLEILGGPIALMPDAHLGKGATVGSVIATKSSIIPAATGVDLGCFRGDTEVYHIEEDTLAVRTSTIQEMAESDQEEFWVYAYSPGKQSVVPAKATATLTRQLAELVKVTILGGEEIFCTPDHEFMLSDGTYRTAESLLLGQELMSLAGSYQVVSVKPVEEKTDVYCLQVPGYNNFALAAGVFVHNCGMIAAKFDLTSNDLPDNLGPMLREIGRSIPSGFNQREHTKFSSLTWLKKNPLNTTIDLGDRDRAKITKQLCTLGGGNHFIEVCLDEEDNVWAVLHSGSRGIGNTLASAHIDKTRDLNNNLGRRLEDPDLAYLLESDPGFQAYIADMLWAQNYAAENRRSMMDSLFHILQLQIGKDVHKLKEINCHHNYAMQETHNGEQVWVTRKGAILADKGAEGVIPGSMGTCTYVVKGLGNPDSYNSASHGAGRTMSRNKAKKSLDLEQFETAMEGRTWQKSRAEKLLDEAPGAYKDLDQVMEDQKDLVEITDKLTAILNYKGV